jgi:hypothetical protein
VSVFAFRRQEVERLFSSTGRALLGRAFQGLRGAVRRQAQLRLVAITRWLEYGKIYQQLPFRAW